MLDSKVESFPAQARDLCKPSTMRALLRRVDLRLSRKLGQHMLADPAVLRSIMHHVQSTDHDHILEIGPGLGSLTVCLAAVARRVVTVELDARMVALLDSTLAFHTNVETVHQDAVAFDPYPYFGETPYMLAANLPYSVATPVMRRLAAHPFGPQRMVVMLQREVAARVCAAPGEMSYLSLLIQTYSEARHLLARTCASVLSAAEGGLRRGGIGQTPADVLPGRGDRGRIAAGARRLLPATQAGAQFRAVNSAH